MPEAPVIDPTSGLSQSLAAIDQAIGSRRLAERTGIDHQRLADVLALRRHASSLDLALIAEALRTTVMELLTAYSDPQRVTVYVCGRGPVPLAEL